MASAMPNPSPSSSQMPPALSTLSAMPPPAAAPAPLVAPLPDPNRRRAESLAAAAVLSAIAVLALWHQTPGQSPAPIPASQAEAWMADCLPRIGAKTRARMADALRKDDIDRLPKLARVQATRWFTW